MKKQAFILTGDLRKTLLPKHFIAFFDTLIHFFLNSSPTLSSNVKF